MKKIFLIIGIVLLSIFGISIFQEFMANHTYYSTMLASWDNWKIVIWALIATAIPLRYIIKAKAFSLKKFFIWILPAALLLFSVAHTMVKDSIMWWPAGFLILCVNSLLLYFLGMYFILGVLSLGTRISDKWIKFRENRRQEMIINFGLGIGTLLLIVYIIAMMRIFHGSITWILFLGLGFMIWFMRKRLTNYKEIITPMFEEFKLHKLKQNRWKRIGIILLWVSIIYYFYGFQLSFIPYSTAWDANHEYMYIPKILAENFGVLRWNAGPIASAPYLWHMFISFWFSLIQPIKSWFRLAPDTIAVAMNFLSGLFVLIFGMGLVKEVLSFFAKPDENQATKEISFGIGWMWILFWLTSGMGAFLVFVDNKTDLWVMAMTILAVLSWFIFLKFVRDSHEHGTLLLKDSLKYIIVSGFLFALASMSKPTAFLDIALFGFLLVGLWIDVILAAGLSMITMWMMGILKVNNAPDIMNSSMGKRVALIGVVIVLGRLINLLLKNYKNFRAQKKKYVQYILIWVVACLAILVIFKWPNVVIRQINDGSFNISNWTRSLLLGQTTQTKTLLAATDVSAISVDQTQTDQSAVDQQSASFSVSACKSQTFSSGDLYKNIKKAVVTNEDVGRYVWYGWKELTRGNGLSLGYYLTRIFYPMNGVCYGLNSDAKLLCKNASAIDAFDIQTINKLFGEVKKNGTAYDLLSGSLAAFQAKSASFSWGKYDANEFRDQIVALRQYYQNHVIYTEAGKIEIPYRYIIPLNVVFNRSLQNLSSYYTDIWFIRLFMLIFVVWAFVYALIKREKNLIVLSGASVVGWLLRWIIGGGIVWYGIGLIMWTILTATMFIKELIDGHEKDKKTTNALYIFFCLLAIWAIIQFVLNFIRISSQGGSWPFERYKMANGQTLEITDQLQQKETVVSSYGWKDVFDLQFPHYNKFIDYVADRADKDWVLIAGTYIQYFLKNQHNLVNDGMLNRFWEQTSDGNECKSYQRLQARNIKYLVIDPNIWTVVMGEGNESLFNRFFAKLDSVTKKIQEHGAISRLVQLWKDGYIKLFSTNNLGAKYAFTVSDQTLVNTFGPMSADDLILIRAKIAIARFFPEAQELLTFIADTFTQRVSNGEAIGDIADIYGKTIDEGKILQLAVTLIEGKDTSTAEASIQALTQDERLVLLQYLGLVNLLKAGNTQYQEYVNNLLSQSLWGGSQLMVFELN